MAPGPNYYAWVVLMAGVVIVSLPFAHPVTVCDTKSFITFNTYLTNRLLNYTARAVAITKALQETDVDVMCLQEVHHEKDMVAIINSVKDIYPYHFSPLHHAPNRLRATAVRWWNFMANRRFSMRNAACKIPELLPLGFCLLTTCRGLEDRPLYECLFFNCPNAIFSMSASCRTCLTMADAVVTRAITRCLDVLRLYNRFNTHGLLFLSKHPITSAQWTPFIPNVPQVFPTAYMDITVATVGRIICTHLTAMLADIYIEFNLRDRYSNYEEQQRGEIELLNDNFANDPHVLLGDLNTGPVVPSRDINGPFPDNYARLRELGYVSVYEEVGGNCTLCSYNPLEIWKGYNISDFNVDHVMSKTFVGGTAERVLETYEDLPLSDHYGVRVDACF